MKDKKIDIQISYGKLEQFTIYISDDLPKLSATIGLYTNGGAKITSFSVDTRSYYGDNQIDLPMGIDREILKIAEEIEIATIRKCREGQLALQDNF